MFLQLTHTRLTVYKATEDLVLEAYRITKKFPADEKFAMISQVRRAALSVHLNLAEGSSRKSQKERNRYFEIARGSVIEVDSAIGIALQLGYAAPEEIQNLGDSIILTFKLLSGMVKSDDINN